MTSLTKMISNAKSQIKTNVGSAKAEIKSTTNAQLSNAQKEVKNVIPGISAAATRKLTQGAQSAIATGISGVRGGVSDILRGNFSGGVEKIISTPSDIMGSLGKTFGLSTGSKLTNPGGVDVGNSLEGALARSDPQMSYNWYCIPPTINAIDGPQVTLPWYFVEEATLPFRTFNVDSFFYQGRQKHMAGNSDLDDLQLAFYADTTNEALKYLQAWQGAVIKPYTSKDRTSGGGGYGRTKDYYRDIPIYLLSPDRKILCEILYTECWPKTIQAYSMNSGSSERVVNHVTFSTGDVFVTLYGVSSTASKGFTPFFTSAIDKVKGLFA